MNECDKTCTVYRRTCEGLELRTERAYEAVSHLNSNESDMIAGIEVVREEIFAVRAQKRALQAYVNGLAVEAIELQNAAVGCSGSACAALLHASGIEPIYVVKELGEISHVAR